MNREVELRLQACMCILSLQARRLRAAEAALDPYVLRVFTMMLAAALHLHPSGLPDTELQRVFDAHQAWTIDYVSRQCRCSPDHRAGDTRKTAGCAIEVVGRSIPFAYHLYFLLGKQMILLKWKDKGLT